MAVAVPTVHLPSVLNLRIHDTSDIFPTPPLPSLEYVVLSKCTALLHKGLPVPSFYLILSQQ
jgi:hypothetical protein